MKLLTKLIIAFGLVVGFSCFASAHGGAHKTLMGTVQNVVEAEIILVTTADGRVSVGLRPLTRYLTTDEEEGSWRELREGMRVSIKLDVQGRTADEVRYRQEASPTRDGEADNE